MEQEISSTTQESLQTNKESPTLLPTNQSSSIQTKKNLYPVVRHILLVLCVLLTFVFILFLMHQNGKSIYDNGI